MSTRAQNSTCQGAVSS